MTPEQRARTTIDRLLEQAGWKFKCEQHAHGSDRAGFADYVLADDAGTAIALLEAKRAAEDSLVGKEQARNYATSLNLPHVILSNGEEHYYWDTRAGDPVRKLAIPSPAAIANYGARPTRDRSRLWTTEVGSDYLARMAKSDRILRDYQLEAIVALQQQAQQGETAFLLEMATGTGKTAVASALCFLYLNTGNARHVLFLVDRIELRQQAVEGINDNINKQYTVAAYEGDPDFGWESTRIAVATVQSLEALTAAGPLPSDQFDLIVADEAHRCISGPNHRRLFDHFDAEKIGLTATPRDFVTNEPVGDDDQSIAAREQRSIRDTYRAFGLEPGHPTFAYTIEQGVKDKYLAPPVAVDVRTEVTTQLMSDEGYQITLEDYENAGGNLELTFRINDLGRAFLSPGTNAEFARVYIEEALREPGSDLIGKGIVYAVDQSHAAALTQALNQAATARWPGVYQSDFAVQVTSNIRDANDHGQRFKNNQLNGRHPAMPAYATSKTRVCVTVAMMTTGYDCPDLLNIGVCRPIKSPTDYTQIKGRGTRRYDFRANITDPRARAQSAERPKARFKIVDFFGVCEYHHEGHYYEARISTPSLQPTPEPESGNGSDYPRPSPGVIIRHGPDAVESETDLTLASDTITINERQERYLTSADDEHQQRNKAVADAFADYLSLYPVDDDAAEKDDVRAFFEAYATDTNVRESIDSKRFASLLGTVLDRAMFRRVPLEHRNRIPDYIREQAGHLLNNQAAA